MARTIDLLLLVRLILKRWYLFAITAAVSLFVALIVTADVQPDIYQAKTTLSSMVEGSATESLAGFRLLANYSGLISSSKIATDAREMLPDSLGISTRQIQSMIATKLSDTSTMLTITSSSSDPQLALSVANAVAEAFIAEIGNITGADTIKIYDRATSASKSFDGKNEQRKTRITIPAACVSLLLAAVVLWWLFSDRIKSVNEVEFGGEVTIIGVIPRT